MITDPIPAHFINIDESLKNSKLQWLIWGGLGLLLNSLICVLNLPISYQCALVALIVLAFVFTQLLTYHVTAMSTLALARLSHEQAIGDVEWQLGITQVTPKHFFIPSHAPSQLWQGLLLQAKGYQVAVILKFWITHPQEKTVNLVIWQDQVSPETWRKLAVVTHHNKNANNRS